MVSLNVCADVGLPAVSEQMIGVREVRSMVQLSLCLLAEPYSKQPHEMVSIFHCS